LQRLHDGKPVICAPEDSFSNHIHALDLARLCFAAAFRDKAPRIVNAVDEEPMKMGDFFDCVAQYAGLPKPPRLPKEAVRAMVSPALWSFMCESRRIVSLRRSALLSSLRYPCVELALPPNQKS
jgi:nucleoside-diphosphate-sugar epimerase